MKTLGQVAYEACDDGGQQTFGPWENTISLVKGVHEQMARAVASHILVRLVREYQTEMSDRERYNVWREIMEDYCMYCGLDIKKYGQCYCTNDE